MKRLILFLISTSFTFFSFGQNQVETVFSKDNENITNIGGYGGPLIQAAQFNPGWGVQIGGKGGVVFNQTFAFGGIGMGMANPISFDSPNSEASLNMSYGAGGVFVEYIFNRNRPVHFSIPINFMGGGVTINDEEDNEVESANLFILEPGVSIEFNVSENFIPALNVYYRQVFRSELENLSNQELSGINIGLMFKFGGF